MQTKMIYLTLAISIISISGCESTSSGPALAPAPASVAAAAPAIRTGSQADEGACERAVSQQANNGDVITLSSEFSQANTEVVVGVGPQRAKWRCLVSRGKVAEVVSLTNEGAL